MTTATVKSIFHDFFGRTTLHGLVNIMNNESGIVRKFVWLVFMVVVNIGFTVVMGLYIIMYLRYDYVTSTKIEFSDSQRFPSISACNLNYYSRQKIEEAGFSMEFFAQSYFMVEGAVDYVTELNNSMFGANFLTFIRNTTYTADEFFVSCKLSIRDAAQSCTPFVTQYHGDTGVCYTFHSHEYIKSQGALYATHDGITDAILITFNVHPEDYVYARINAEGMQVHVHSPDYEPNMEENTILLSPATSTVMALQKVIIK